MSTETLRLLASQGLEWAATDEDILAATLGRPLAGSARSELYRPHRFRAPGGRELAVFFRDKGLADLIGFSYSGWEPDQAARDLVSRLEAITRAHGADCTIPIILDGENAWEFYRRNGEPFLRSFYRSVREHPGLVFAPMAECSRAAVGNLERVHAGSWIYGSFSTWAGHPEKNRAWELLERTRCRLADEDARLDPSDRALAWQEIYAAEGSDWFWWLGDDHYSPIAGEFDQLFRLHLMNVYRLLGLPIPQELHIPIKGGVRAGLLEPAVGPLRPTVDGRITSYFEWLPGGAFDLGFDAGAMHRTDRKLQRLRFGAGPGEVFLCVEGDRGLEELRGQGLWLEVKATGARTVTVRFPVDGGEAEVVEGAAVPAAVRFSWGRVAEVALPAQALGWSETAVPAGELYASFRLLREGEVVERAPLYQMARLELPADPDLEAWSA